MRQPAPTLRSERAVGSAVGSVEYEVIRGRAVLVDDGVQPRERNPGRQRVTPWSPDGTPEFLLGEGTPGSPGDRALGEDCRVLVPEPEVNHILSSLL